jgi:hypothetical protein
MAILLHVRPDVSAWSREEFYDNAPPYSIALDGIVSGSTWRDHKRHYANFDHHEGCDRLGTRATCEQIYFAILQGFFNAFKVGKEIVLNVFVNDCDEDVCMAVYCLRHRKMIGKEENGRLRRLVDTEGRMDCVGGCLNIRKDAPILEEMAWIFDPYRSARLAGRLKSRDPQVYRETIEAVEFRIHENIHGRGQRKALELKYEKIHCGEGWDMIVEEGGQARLGFVSDGGAAFVSVHKRPDGKVFDYSIGRIGPDIPFHLFELYNLLNQVEGRTESSDRWGGSDLIGGSPRIAGSQIQPEDLAKLIDEYIRQQT